MNIVSHVSLHIIDMDGTSMFGSQSLAEKRETEKEIFVLNIFITCVVDLMASMNQESLLESTNNSNAKQTCEQTSIEVLTRYGQQFREHSSILSTSTG